MLSRFMIGLFGWIWWTILPVRKQLAVRNFKSSFPEEDERTLRTTVGVVAWGYLELLFGGDAHVEGVEQVQPGSICLGGHAGSWDLILVAVAKRIPTTIFVKTPLHPLAAWAICHMRSRADLELLPPQESMKAAYAALESGRMVMFVQDQRHNRGIVSDFWVDPPGRVPHLRPWFIEPEPPWSDFSQERTRDGHRC